MVERYYSMEYEEMYYIFDNRTFDKEELEEELEYSSCPLEYSLTDDEILDLLNQLAEMKEVGLRNVSCLNCAFLDDKYEGEKKRKHCKKRNDREMNTVLICDEWRKAK